LSPLFIRDDGHFDPDRNASADGILANNIAIENITNKNIIADMRII
jgi:hypothetical protein